MNGYEVLDRIRDMPSRADTPVVVVTAKHDPEGVLREMGSGATDHIAKPFLPSELEAVVERALHGSAADVERERKTLEFRRRLRDGQRATPPGSTRAVTSDDRGARSSATAANKANVGS
jgi:DNA-binding response OmpR family regulator